MTGKEFAFSLSHFLSWHAHEWSKRVMFARHSTHCNTLQQTATHCNTQKHTTTNCNTLHDTEKHYNKLQHTARHRNTLQQTAAHCKTQKHTRNTLVHKAHRREEHVCVCVCVCVSLLYTVCVRGPRYYVQVLLIAYAIYINICPPLVLTFVFLSDEAFCQANMSRPHIETITPRTITPPGVAGDMGTRAS